MGSLSHSSNQSNLVSFREMSDAAARLWKTAEALSAVRRENETVADYQELAELFARFTHLDNGNLGPELARLQNFSRVVPPQRLNLRGKLRRWFFGMANPLLAKFLRAASLESASHEAYELAVHLQQQQMEAETRILAELRELTAKVKKIESDQKSRHFHA
jgi:hypothetical protein